MMSSTRTCGRNSAAAGLGIAVFAMLLAPFAQAQDSDSKLANLRQERQEAEQVQTFFLKNATQQNDLNDLTTDLRNMLPHAKIYAVWSQAYAISIRSNADDLQSAQKLIAQLDQPKKVYRITFTITETDSGKKTGTQHYSLIVAGDNKAVFKQGNRVPIVTGTTDKDSGAPITQIQYLDVGINIEAAVNGVGLRTKIEESSIADEKSSVGIQDPLLRQTMLESMSTFTPGKAITLGSIDIPGTTRHQDVEVAVELAQ
jgi:type II secretory pathway component GspD/PulD (secretin)